MVHELKIWPEYFNAVLDGSKTFEVRKDDREFKVGDTLLLREYQPGSQDYTVYPPVIRESKYTGRIIEKEISYIFKGGIPGYRIRKGLVILGIKSEGIVLKNIDLNDITIIQEVNKYDEETKEFNEAFYEYTVHETIENKEHLIEEYFDVLQSMLGLLDKLGITAQEVMQEYPKHLEKIKNRPRVKEGEYD